MSTQTLNNLVFIVWPNGICHDDILFKLCSDIGSQKNPGQTIKTLYSKTVHITYVTHSFQDLRYRKISCKGINYIKIKNKIHLTEL